MGKSRLGSVVAAAGLIASLGVMAPSAFAADQCTHGSSVSTNGIRTTRYTFIKDGARFYKGSILVHRHHVTKTEVYFGSGATDVKNIWIDCPG